jgi:hypothetical protein
MSEKEKQLVEMVAKLPDKAQREFISQVKGAVSALDAIGALPTEKPKKEAGNDDA